MANYEATKYNFTAADMTGIQGVNTGIIVPWSSTSIPSGFLECDGAAVSRTTYADLFAVVGTTYGSGDGSTTFNLPDMSEKCCKKKSPTTNLGTAAGSSTVTVTGNVGGSASPHTLTTPEIPSHAHPTLSHGRSPGNSGGWQGSTNNTGGGGAHTHNLSANFAGNAISTLQPTMTLLYIIKT